MLNLLVQVKSGQMSVRLIMTHRHATFLPRIFVLFCTAAVSVRGSADLKNKRICPD